MCVLFFFSFKKKKKLFGAGLGIALNKLLVPNSINNQVSLEYLCFSWPHKHLTKPLQTNEIY